MGITVSAAEAALAAWMSVDLQHEGLGQTGSGLGNTGFPETPRAKDIWCPHSTSPA